MQRRAHQGETNTTTKTQNLLHFHHTSYTKHMSSLSSSQLHNAVTAARHPMTPPPCHPSYPLTCDAPRSQPIPNGEADVILRTDVQDFIPMLISKVLLVFQEAQLGMNGAATTDNAGDTVCSERDVAEQHTSMNGKVVHTLGKRW